MNSSQESGITSQQMNPLHLHLSGKQSFLTHLHSIKIQLPDFVFFLAMCTLV